jgi:hypothetical protein
MTMREETVTVGNAHVTIVIAIYNPEQAVRGHPDPSVRPLPHLR